MRLAFVLLVVACSSGSRPAPPPPIVERCKVCPDATQPHDATTAQDAPGDIGPDTPPIPRDASIDAPVPPDGPSGARPRILLPSQRARLVASLGSPAAQRWKAITARWLAGEDLWGFDAWNGALVAQLTGDQRYCTKAVAAIDAQVSAAESRIAQGSTPEAAGDSYLGVGELIGDLALVYDWCSPSDAQRLRWVVYANQAVWNVWHHSDARWGTRSAPWTGWSVDNPSNNYYYSFLRATMLLGLATQNPEWLALFSSKIKTQLVPQFNAQLHGGGSREGTGYGTAMRNLWELYLLWEWSTGERIADLTPHTRASLGTLLAGIVPTLDRFAPTGDQSRDSTASLFDYHRAYLLELIALYPGDAMAGRAVSLLAASSVPEMQNGFMLSYDFLYAPTVAPRVPDLPLVTYAPGIGEIYARTRWDVAPMARGRNEVPAERKRTLRQRPGGFIGTNPITTGPRCNRESETCRWPAQNNRRGLSRRISSSATWVNLIAGPFTESHAHQDQGSLMLYRGGWLVTDAVIWSKSGLPQGTDAHSLVRIDGVGQRNSETAGKVLALHAGPGYVFASVDVSGAYSGQTVRRQVLWLEPDVVLVYDHTITTAPTTFQLVVAAAPQISGPTATVTSAGHTLRVTRPGAQWTVTSLAGGDFTAGYRLDDTLPAGDRTRVTAISIDSTAPVPAVTWSDVGASWNGITLGPGVDQL